MTTTTKTKVKFGYLSYDDMLARIESGELNEYDIVFSKDKFVTYLISEELRPIELRSRVYIYSSIDEAMVALNQNTDTYIGQIVSILDGDAYRGYIVNENVNGYIITPLYENPNSIDYNKLGNRPIENYMGTLDNPIIVEELLSGIYKIKGQYKILDNEETVYLSVDGDLFLVEVSETEKLIKRFTKDSIYDFVITDNDIKKNVYVTDDYLTSRGYTTNDYIDSKILALEESIKVDIQSYVEDIITEKVDMIIDERLDIKLEERIQETSNEEVESLFV